jgi:hypothetical protein
MTGYNKAIQRCSLVLGNVAKYLRIVKMKKVVMSLALISAASLSWSFDMGKLAESVDTTKAVQSVDQEKLADSVSKDGVDVEKAVDSVDKEKAIQSVDLMKAKDAFTQEKK